MKKVGKEVLFLETSKNNPRNGEGTFIRLKDGGILFAFTEYYGECGEDHGIARFSACYSYDEGETWSEKKVLIEKDEGAQNIMSNTLVRLGNGDLGIIYLRKEINEQKGCYCMPVIRRSSDEGKTWSDYVYCSDRMGYYCPFNGSALMLRDGRIMIPVTYNHEQLDVFGLGVDEGEGGFAVILCSEDDGKTWYTMPHRFTAFGGAYGDLSEPAMYEHENGDLWLWFRTYFGNQYQSVSKDGGKTWTDLVPNFFFISPDSPMQVKKTGKLTSAVFNPVPYYHGNTSVEDWRSPRRTPLALAISHNDGREFSDNKRNACNGGMLNAISKDFYLIENDLNDSYCYPAIFEGDDYMLVGYYHSNGTTHCLNCAKVTKIMYNELTNE